MNRLIEFIEYMNKENVRDITTLSKRILLEFGSEFRCNRIEADYVTKYLKGELNFSNNILNLHRETYEKE